MATMDTHSDSRAGTPPLRRVLAVVYGSEDKAREVVARFAAEGDDVEARWYADRQALLDDVASARFEAVILCPNGDEATGDADEAALRVVLADTPLFRVA